MSFLPSIRASTRQAMRTNFAVPAATFHSSAARSLKENDKNREDLPNHYEYHKQESLKGSKVGKGQWKSELASESEAEVKADRGELDGDVTFKEMQEKTKHVRSEKVKQ
ncbi:hypothetical protein N7447_009881 [Penicillium robsamsonii]|uniref:uncharacterized protein n=1 Tax=Penicillium robsamsonii TaxID=1792511 RepID=UPI002547D91C|nr:uncharacterized protein N7447_009881 [Penicillium robsamsonii]KAJ5812858.1 hypothetical protein N7447_009881 [Penicillium robsamsonii]